MNAEILTVYDTPWVTSPDEVSGKGMPLLSAPVPADRHLAGDRSFFEGKSIKELAQSQGVGPVNDVSVFAGGIPDDEDVDEMLEEIYRLRKP
jgi:hypothetical protein